MFCFPLKRLSEIFLSIRRTERDKIKNIFTKSIRYSCSILMKLEFSQQIFEKYSDIKFHEMPSSGRGVVLCGQTDGYEEANSRFSEN